MYSIVLDKLISEKVLKEPWLTQEPHKCLIAGQQFCYHCMKRWRCSSGATSVWLTIMEGLTRH